MNLDNLTVPYLTKLAKELNITLKSSSKKSEKIQTILNAGISEKRLEELYNKYLAQYQASKGKPKSVKKSSRSKASKLEDRVFLLEGQVKYLMSKIDNLEIQIASGRINTTVEDGLNISAIQNIIKSKVYPGNSISIDEIVSIKELQKFPINLIENAIIDLIDEEVFDASEGRSIQKIQGNIGRLIRR